MNAEARRAIRTIRRCIDHGRFRLLQHFIRRMDQRGMVWLDVLTVLEKPTEVRTGDDDPWGRSKWIIGGRAVDGLPLELVCVIDEDELGDLTVFITIYWPDR